MTYAHFKHAPSDFIVTERLNFPLSGKGEHLWLYVKKISTNTQHAIALIATYFGVATKDVGYGGQKDRHAITYQWLSIKPKRNKNPDPAHFYATMLAKGADITLLYSTQHNKKLSVGGHHSNHFYVILRHIRGNHTINARLQKLTKTGFPNYFGDQRFGKDNLSKAYELLGNKKRLKAIKYAKAPDELGFMLSVARSAIFNAILDKRCSDDSWHSGLDGDVFMLAGSQSIFCTPLTDDITQRLDAGDIHPTAPLVGIAGKQSNGKAWAVENEVITSADYAPLVYALHYLKIKQHRRALRVLPQALSYHWQDDNLMLDFVLPKGAYATSLLTYLVDELVDKSPNA